MACLVPLESFGHSSYHLVMINAVTISKPRMKCLCFTSDNAVVVTTGAGATWILVHIA